MPVITDIPLLEALLADWRGVLGDAFPGYSNHCRRVFNFCTAFAGADGNAEKIAIAAAFHDLGIWSDDSFDYLAPSRRLLRVYLAESGRGGWADELEAMIENHHKLTPCREHSGGLVEAFRKADWVDVSLGTRRWNLPRSFVAEVRAAFPNAGFHKTLLTLTRQRMCSHPLSPLPMMKL